MKYTYEDYVNESYTDEQRLQAAMLDRLNYTVAGIQRDCLVPSSFHPLPFFGPRRCSYCRVPAEGEEKRCSRCGAGEWQ